MGLLICPAVALDAAPVAAVFLAARRMGMPWLRVLHSDPATHGWVRTMLLRSGTVWVAEAAGRIVGLAVLCADVLTHLYVHPTAWGRDVGTQRLDKVRAREHARYRCPLNKLQRPREGAALDKLALYVFQRTVRFRRFDEAEGFTLCALGTGASNEEREPDAYDEWHRLAPVPGGR